jgi:hypothetical protein
VGGRLLNEWAAGLPIIFEDVITQRSPIFLQQIIVLPQKEKSAGERLDKSRVKDYN